MIKIKLPPLPKPHGEVLVYDFNAKPNAPVLYQDIFTADQLRARDLEVARLVLEAAALVCDEVAVDATSEKRMKFLTVQGKAVYEGMYGGAINCAGGIRALEISHD